MTTPVEVLIGIAAYIVGGAVIAGVILWIAFWLSGVIERYSARHRAARRCGYLPPGVADLTAHRNAGARVRVAAGRTTRRYPR